MSSQASPQEGIADEVEKAFAQNTQIARWHQESCFIIETNFLCAVTIVSDDGFGRSQGLGQGSSQAFPRGQMDDDVHQANKSRDCRRRHEAGKTKVLL